MESGGAVAVSASSAVRHRGKGQKLQNGRPSQDSIGPVVVQALQFRRVVDAAQCPRGLSDSFSALDETRFAQVDLLTTRHALALLVDAVAGPSHIGHSGWFERGIG